MAFDVSAFLRQHRSELLANKLQDVIKNCPSKYRGQVSETLMSWGIDVFKYLPEIPEACFAGSSITSVSIPESVRSISNGAFAGCEKLVSVDIQDGVEFIGDDAFAHCSNLSAVTLPDTIDRIPQRCFYACSNISELYIPESVKIIGLNAFEGCGGINLTTPYRERRVDKLRVKSGDEEFFRKNLTFLRPEKPVAEGLELDESEEFSDDDSVIIDADKETLQEAFSDTMPDWLKKRMLRGKGGKAASNLTNSDPLAGSIKGRNDEVDLFREFLNHGIDLSSAEFLHGEIPTGPRDPRLKDPYIPIFLVKGPVRYGGWWGNSRINSGDQIYQVYAKGINDHEINLLSDDQDTIFGYTSMKKLLPTVADFVYIDTSNAANDMSDKKSARAQLKQELRELKDYFRETNPDVIIRNNSYRWGPKYDKSGYIKDPHKYDAKLAELRKKNYSKTINQLRDRLVEAKQDIVAIMSELDLEKMSNSTLSISGIRDLLGYLQQAQVYYEQMCKNIELALNADNEYFRDSYFNTAVGPNGYSSDTNTYLDRLERDIAPYKNVILDW